MLRRLILVAAAFFLFVAAFQRPQGDRIVAVGDVHGNLDGLTAILQKSGLIDRANHWIGGRATLVQLGDMVDRGARSRAVLDFLMALQREAPQKGGSVRISLGNHEVMNIMGDLRYVVPGDYEGFVDNRSEQRRNSAFRDYSRLEARNGRVADEAAWMKAHPLGFVEHREAFGPRGKYGKWLRTLPAVNKVGDTIFLHGGIDPALNAQSIDQINSAIISEIFLFDKITRYMIDNNLALPFFTIEEFLGFADAEVKRIQLKLPAEQTEEDRARIQILQGLLQFQNWLSVHDNGPLWFRGYDRWSEEEEAGRLAPLAQLLGAKRFVVGHTIQPNGGVRGRFGGMVFLIDTGMLRGSVSALEILDGRIRALYMDREMDLN
jgi:hypothetical protein